MAAEGVSRDDLARQAEKHLRQGRTDLALELYERLAQCAPTDWNAVKQLADLLERAGHREAAAGRFLQCADHHFAEGFHARAAALYRKVLKLEPLSEHALCQLAEVSLALKLKADARLAFGQVLSLRRRRGDAAGVEVVTRRLAEIEDAGPPPPSLPPPAPPTAEDVSRRLRQVAADADGRGDAEGATRAWLAVLQRDPADRALRGRLVHALLDRQELDTARGLLEWYADDDPEGLAWRFDVAQRDGRSDLAQTLAEHVVQGQPADADRLPDVFATLHDVREILRARNAQLADTWCSRVIEALVQRGRDVGAVTFIEAAEARHPLSVECHLRWVDLCVDGNLDGLDRAQQALAAAYLRGGQAELARAVADDLLLRRPDLPDVRTLVLTIHQACGEPDPERSVAHLLAPPAVDVPDQADQWVAPADVDESGACPVDVADPMPLPGPPEVRAPLVSAPLLTTRPEVVLPAFAAFDWGALLGREPEPVSPPDELPAVPDATADVPLDVPLDVLPDVPLDVVDDPWAVLAGPVPDPDEVDLTEQLEQLRPQQGPFVPEAVPQTPRPAEATPTWSGPTRPASGAPTDTAAGGGVAGEPSARHAAQQVAAGRVFAAAGLAAEAARAFERAASDARTRFEAAEALAGLHRSRGQLIEAIRWYDEAAHAPVPDTTVRRPVLYDLAETLEAAGQPDRALAVLLDLLSEVEDYRDARARADRLLRVDAGG